MLQTHYHRPAGKRLFVPKEIRRASGGLFGFSLGSGQSSAVPAAPGTIVGIDVSLGSTAGLTHVVAEVADSTGMTDLKFDGVSGDNFAIEDGTHVSADTPAHARGDVDVIVTNAGGDSDPLVDGFTYQDALSFSGTTEFWVRADLGAHLDVDAFDVPVVDLFDDQSGYVDANRYLQAPSSGLRPYYSASHARWKGQAAFHTDPALDQERRMNSGVLSTPIARGYTVYQSLCIPAGAASKDVYWMIANGTLTSSAGLYGKAGASAMHAGSNSDNLTFTISQDVKYIVCRVYLAAGGTTVYLNRYSTSEGTQGSATASCVFISTGTYAPDNTKWEQREIIIRAGEDDAATRQAIMEYMGEDSDIAVAA